MTPSCSPLACLLGFLALTACSPASAQTPTIGRPPYQGGVGLGIAASDSPYAGEGTRINPVPLVFFEGDRFFFRGVSGGMHLLQGDTVRLDAIAALRMDGIRRKDFGTHELARNGIDRALLEDRDNGLDMGLTATWAGGAGDVEFTAKADVTGASKGYELVARYGYDIPVGKGRLTPGISVSHLSSDMADYYYGILDDEVARGVVQYTPNAATVPTVGVTYVRPIGTAWQFMGRAQYSALPDALSDSPLLERGADGIGTIMIGVSRGF